VKELDTFPLEGLLRLPDIIGDPKSDPPTKAIIPVSKSTWWAGVREGRFPQPIKLGPNTTAWRAADIRKFLDSLRSTA